MAHYQMLFISLISLFTVISSVIPRSNAFSGNRGNETDRLGEEPRDNNNNNMSLSDIIGNRQVLINHMFHDYDKKNYPIPGQLKFGLSLLRFDADEKNNIVDLDVWLTNVWSDPRFSWDPEIYQIKTLKVLPSEIWTPDISLYNTAEPQSHLSCRDTNVVIDHTGKIEWIPSCKLRAYCQLDLKASPLTEQKCTLKFGSWIFDGFELDLQFYADIEGVDMSNYSDLTAWNITDYRAYRRVLTYQCCPEPYVTLNYEFLFHRKNVTS